MGEKMEKISYLITDAAKQIKVENHVLRYWEEELDIKIKRNELGHRYYTEEDIEKFRKIKKLKEEGIQLKAIRRILHTSKLEMIEPYEIYLEGSQSEKRQHIEEVNKGRQVEESKHVEDKYAEDKYAEEDEFIEQGKQVTDEKHIERLEEIQTSANALRTVDSGNEKALRLQYLLKQMIGDTVKVNMQEVVKEVKDSIIKEMDYQFRLQEEQVEKREEDRKKREEEHYKNIDELLRNKMNKKKKIGFREKEAKEKSIQS